MADLSEPSPARAWTSLVILILAVLLAYVDRQALALLVEPIRRDLSLDDTHIGLLQGPAFALFYAGAGLLLGWAVDRHHRRNIMLAGLLAWSMMTLLSGLAQNFAELFACRIGIGIGEACLIPGVFSVLGDLFEPRRKPLVFAVYAAAILVGTSLSTGIVALALGAIERGQWHLGGLTAPWRLCFVAVASPAPLLALAFLAIPEPPRRRTTAVTSHAGSDWSFFREHTSLLALMLVGLAGASAVFQTLSAWGPTVLVRQSGWPPRVAGLWFSGALGVSALVAASLGAFLSTRSPDKGSRPLLLASIVGLAGAIPSAAIAGLPGGGGALIGLALVAVAVLVPYSLAPAMLQSVTPNAVWGRTASLFKLVELLGVSVLAFGVGALSDWRGGSRSLGVALAVALAVAAAIALAALLTVAVRHLIPTRMEAQ